MTHAQIAADARRPYVAKIKQDQATIDALAAALSAAIALQHPWQHPGVVKAARDALAMVTR
jgi:hypothetical protein